MLDGSTLHREKADFLFEVIKRYDHYIATTNFKAGLLLSFVAAIVLGLTVRLLFIGQTGESPEVFPVWTVIFTLSTIISSLVVAVCLMLVVFPKIKLTGGDQSLIFFSSVSKNSIDPNAYCEKVLAADYGDLLSDLAKQVYEVALLVDYKFRALKIAVVVMLFFTIPLLLFSIIALVGGGS